MKKVGLIILSVITVFVLAASPPACVILGLGENLGDAEPGYYHLLSLVPLAVIALIWALVFIVSRKPAIGRSKSSH